MAKMHHITDILEYSEYFSGDTLLSVNGLCMIALALVLPRALTNYYWL